MNHPSPGTPPAEGRGIERVSKTETIQDAEKRLTREGVLWGPFAALVAKWEAAELVAAQAAQLKDELMTRGAPAAPDVFYPALPHKTLYDAVHEISDPGTVGEYGQAWNDLGNHLAEFNDAIVNAVNTSSTKWTGENGDAARRALFGAGSRGG